MEWGVSTLDELQALAEREARLEMDMPLGPGLGDTQQTDMSAQSEDLAKLAQEVDSVLQGLQDWQRARQQHLRDYTEQLAQEYGFPAGDPGMTWGTLDSLGGATDL